MLSVDDAPMKQVASDAGSPRISSLSRADAILTAVMRSGDAVITLSRIASDLGLTKTTVFAAGGTIAWARAVALQTPIVGETTRWPRKASSTRSS